MVSCYFLLVFVEGGRRGSGVPLNYSMTGVLLPLQAVLQNNQKQRLFSWIAVNTYHKPHKTPKKLKNPLQNAIKQCILINAVTLIALKLEVAARWKHIAGFQWSECHVRKLAASHCTTSYLERMFHSRAYLYGHTRISVQSPLVALDIAGLA